MPTLLLALLCSGTAGTSAWLLRGALLQRLDSSASWLRHRPHVWLAAMGGGASALWAPSWQEGALLTGVSIGLALLVVADLATHRLPDVLLAASAGWVLTCLSLIAAFDGSWLHLGRALLAGTSIGAVFFLLCLLRPSGLGLGDAKLAALLGLLLGWFGWKQVLLAVFFAFILGGLFALALLLTRRAGRNTAVAFGPWLVAGAVTAMAWTPPILP